MSARPRWPRRWRGCFAPRSRACSSRRTSCRRTSSDRRCSIPGGALLVSPRAGVHARAPRRRDQPRLAAHAVGAARGDERGAGDGGRDDAPPALAVLRDRHAEPRRLPGHVPAPGGAARSLLAPHRRRLPAARGRAAHALLAAAREPARPRRARGRRGGAAGDPGGRARRRGERERGQVPALDRGGDARPPRDRARRLAARRARALPRGAGARASTGARS